MSYSYEDYEREYSSNLLKVRSFLSSTRSLSSLQECDRLLSEAKRAAISMQGLAEVEGNAFKVGEAKNRIQREVLPLVQEVQNAVRQKQGGGILNKKNNLQERNELFHNNNNNNNSYRPPPMGAFGSKQNSSSDLESLIRNSESMLQESQSLCAESEHIGNNTLLTMQVQRDQLHNASENLKTTTEKIEEAGAILRNM